MRPLVWTVAFALLAAQAIPLGSGEQTDVRSHIRNQTPVVIQIDGVPERVLPLAGGEREVTFSFMAQDPNGWQDIVRAEVGLYQPDNLTFMRYADVSGVSGGDGASHWFNATFTMWYHEMPSAADNYTLHIKVVDQQGAWSKPRYAEFEYAELAAISITTTETSSGNDGGNNTTQEEPSLGFGSTSPGESSDITAVNITNTGNVEVDVELYGTDLLSDNGYSIPVSAVRYDLDALLANETALTHEPLRLDIDLLPGSESSQTVYWVLRVPTGDEQYIPAGSYSGSITINAVV